MFQRSSSVRSTEKLGSTVPDIHSCVAFKVSDRNMTNTSLCVKVKAQT